MASFPAEMESAPNSGIRTAIRISPAGCETASTPRTGRRRLCTPPRKSETPQEQAEARLIAKASNPIESYGFAIRSRPRAAAPRKSGRLRRPSENERPGGRLLAAAEEAVEGVVDAAENVVDRAVHGVGRAAGDAAATAAGQAYL